MGSPDVPLPNMLMKMSVNGLILAFSRALRTELYGKGVSVSLI